MRALARMVLVGAMTAVLVTLPAACNDTTTVVDCVVGTHYPPGREDACVPDTVPRATAVTLLAAARTAARENQGVAQRVVVVEALRSEVQRYLGATVPGSDGLVWVVEVGGTFRCGRECFGSIETPAVTGTAIIEDLNVKTLTASDFSLRKAWVDLSHLGPVHVLR